MRTASGSLRWRVAEILWVHIQSAVRMSGGEAEAPSDRLRYRMLAAAFISLGQRAEANAAAELAGVEIAWRNP